MSLTNQPNDIIRYIFSYLSLQDIIRVELTAKQFIGVKKYNNIEKANVCFKKSKYVYNKEILVLFKKIKQMNKSEEIYNGTFNEIYKKKNQINILEKLYGNVLKNDMIKTKCYTHLTKYIKCNYNPRCNVNLYHKSNAPEFTKNDEFTNVKGDWFVFTHGEMVDISVFKAIKFISNLIFDLTGKRYEHVHIYVNGYKYDKWIDYS